MGTILEPQFDGEIMKLPNGSVTGEPTPPKGGHASVWIVVFLIAAVVLGGGGWFMWSQWEALIAPIIVPTPVLPPVTAPATSTPGIPSFVPPPSDSTEIESITTDLDSAPLDTIDNDLDELDRVIYELTAPSQP